MVSSGRLSQLVALTHQVSGEYPMHLQVEVICGMTSDSP
jgi:hypothetical protein